MTKRSRAKVVIIFSNANEVKEGGQIAVLPDTLMDLHNNFVGIKIGLENLHKTDNELASIAWEALNNGELVILDKDFNLLPSSLPQSFDDVENVRAAYRAYANMIKKESVKNPEYLQALYDTINNLLQEQKKNVEKLEN